MNYIKHLNKVFERFYEDDRLLTSHIALYMTLFQTWNHNRFANPVLVNRAEVMKAAKISSFSTYTRCLRELHEWQYIQYLPSRNPTQGTKVIMYNFCNTDCKSNCNTSSTKTVIATVTPPYINNTNTNKEDETSFAPTLEEVFYFFREQKFPEQEAKKFYHHYQSNGWLVGGKTPMQDWQAAARKWMLNTPKFNAHAGDKQQPKLGGLHTNRDKDYSEPL